MADLSTRPQVRVLRTAANCEVVTTVTLDGRFITFDSFNPRHGPACAAVALNLTEDECKALITNLVGALNDYQRLTRENTDG